MNYKKAVLLLLHILDDYGEHFLFHDLFLAELESLLKGSLKGNESSFFKALTKTLKNLNEHGKEINRIDGHEILSHIYHNNQRIFYSLHITTTSVNIRLLVSFINEKAVFLVCFNEKSGKKISSYQKYINVMIRRLDEMEE